MSGPAPSRRGRTRWLIFGPMAVLALLLTGIVALESATPSVTPVGRLVEGLPPLALTEARTCIRQRDDVAIEEIRDLLWAGGRVSSTQVLACPEAFDGRDVSFAGEVVGDLLHRRGGAWVQVNDDAYALELGPLTDHRERRGFNQGLAVWLPDGLHERVGELGNSRRRGDVILVRGILRRADPDDGGGLTIRAEELEVLAPSLAVEAPLHTLQAVTAGVLALLALASLEWSRRSRRR